MFGMVSSTLYFYQVLQWKLYHLKDSFDGIGVDIFWNYTIIKWHVMFNERLLHDCSYHNFEEEDYDAQNNDVTISLDL